MGNFHLRVATAAAFIATTLITSVAAQTVRFVPHADLKILDTTWTNALITRNHGLMVYDTLFALDAKLQPKPQMVESFIRSPDGLTWSFTLRKGMKFHDGTTVSANDAVASLKRWHQRRVDGTAMMAAAKSLTVKDELTFELKFNQVFGPVLETLANPILPTFVLRAKDVAGDAFQQQNWDKVVGSGPFTFDKNDWVPGSKVIYRKFKDYIPRAEPASGWAGGKVVNVDAVEWVILSDQATAVQALMRGEIDVIEQAQHDLLPLAARDPNVVITVMDPMGWQGLVRPNSLHPPFDKPQGRQALAMLVDQKSYLMAMIGDEKYAKPCLAILICGSPYETDAGTSPFKNRDVARAKELLKEAGYKGEPVVLMAPTDNPLLNAIGIVTAQNMRDAGINVDLHLIDWGTLSTRQQRKDKPGPGSPGWNLYVTAAPGLLFFNPLTNFALATPCDGKNWNGWACDEELEKRRVSFGSASDPAARKKVIDSIQTRYYESIPFVNVGQYLAPKIWRKAITNVAPGTDIVFWNLKKG
ncbi:MAG: ABC transporter substrate-binding protein [Betaproteobacteria bacterium]|jgi:peptide/nickel transport system substrate-binding protein|nr:ABC transporter substrate-binding protein [Betaproteobacteria bacterium]